MMKNNCEKKDALHQALKSKVWPDALRQHVAGCPQCTAELRVFNWMSHFATTREDGEAQLSPHLLWMQNSFARQHAGRRRIRRSVLAVQLVLQTIAWSAVLVLLLMNLDQLQNWIGQISSGFNQGWSQLYAGGVSHNLIMVFVAIVFFIISFYPMLNTISPKR